MFGLLTLTGCPVGWGLGIIWTDGLLETTWLLCGTKLLDPINSAGVTNKNYYSNQF